VDVADVTPEGAESPSPTRRSVLAALGAGIGLAVSYALFAGYAVAYLFPPPVTRRVARLFIGRRSDISPGSAWPFVDQRGRTLLVVVNGEHLVAFDTRCPHLGCKVHWEAEQNRFVCPCHQGVFDRDGVAIAGPPAAAGQSLDQATLEIDAGSGTVFLREG